jgi:hypothetical protein
VLTAWPFLFSRILNEEKLLSEHLGYPCVCGEPLSRGSGSCLWSGVVGPKGSTYLNDVRGHSLDLFLYGREVFATALWLVGLRPFVFSRH